MPKSNYMIVTVSNTLYFNRRLLRVCVVAYLFLLGTRSLLPCGQNFPGSNKYVIRKPCNLIIKLATAFRQTHQKY